MLINQGLPAKSVSGRLGHANIGTTYDIYGHYLKSTDKEASDRLEQVYKNMKGNGYQEVKK
jgi:integrase